MKSNYLILIIILTISISVNAQKNTAINFQAIARNADGSILPNKFITVRLTLREGDIDGRIEYQEMKSVSTNVVGLFNLLIGNNEYSRIVVTGNYDLIDWTTGNKFLQVEIDPSNSINFLTLGTQKLNFVPYAIYSSSVNANNIIGTIAIDKGGTGTNSLNSLKSSMFLNNVDNTPDLLKPISAATFLALTEKENIQNRSTNIQIDENSLTKYPTVKAVKDYVDGLIVSGAPLADANTKGILKLAGDLSGTADSPIVSKLNGTSLANLNSGILKNQINTGKPSIAIPGTDYLLPNGDASGLTNFPLFNQNTTGNAATASTSISANYATLAGNITSSTNNTLSSLSNLSSIGTITQGTWSATAIDIAHGGTGSTTQNFVDLTTIQTIISSKTFSSTLTANTFIKKGGTANQFLKADGSIDNNNYELNFDTTYLNKNILQNASTGIISFGGIVLPTPTGATTFNVGAVSGIIVDNTTNPNAPIVKYITYPGASGLTVDMISGTETYVLLNASGTLEYQYTVPTVKQRRQKIYLGKLTHTEHTEFVNAYSQPDIVLSGTSQMRDIWDPIHLINGGVYPSPNGANLQFNTSAGNVYGLGIGWSNDPLSPSTLPVSSQTATSFKYRTQSNGISSYVNSIDPSHYDVNGTVTLVGGTTRATNQRIFLLQNGEIRVQYGQVYYSSLANAISGVQTESFITFPNFRDNGVLIGILSVRANATDLSNIAQAQFLMVSKFGEAVGAAGGISTGSLQQAYNNSTIPQITTSTIGPVTIQRGSSLDTDKVFEINNGTTNSKFSITGEGNMSFGDKAMKIDFLSCTAVGTFTSNMKSGTNVFVTHANGTGIYTISFGESTYTIAPVATASLNGIGMISVNVQPTNIIITTYDITGTPTDKDFNLIALYFK